MQRFSLLRRLVDKFEPIFIISLIFGWPIVNSTEAILRHRESRQPNSDSAVIVFLSIELSLTALGILALRLRGYKPTDLGLRPIMTLADIRTAAALLACHFAAMLALTAIEALLVDSPLFARPAAGRSHANVAAYLIILFCCINPIYEEVFVSGYLITATRRSAGTKAAALASAAIRFLYHTYEGWAAVFAIVPFGLLCAIFYLRRGRLAPLILAHSALNFLSWMSR